MYDIAVLTDGRYLQSMLNTLLLSVAVTLATLAIGATVGIYLARRSFAGKQTAIRPRHH